MFSPGRFRIGNPVVAVAALLLAVCAASAAGKRPEGVWRLEQQTYGSGGRNLAQIVPPLELELRLVGERPEGRLRIGGDRPRTVDWPAVVPDAGPLPVTELERGYDPETGEVHVRYRVRQSSTDDLVLEIEERYRASADGEELTGEVRVRFTGGSRNRGGFVLHRRFARVR